MSKKKFRVQLARLVRETKTIVVEAESAEQINLGKLYEEDESGSRTPDGIESDWECDAEWGCDEATHTILGERDTFPWERE